MKCLYCGGSLVRSRGLSEQQFCSDDHRFRHEAETRLSRYDKKLPLPVPRPAAPKSTPGYLDKAALEIPAVAFPTASLAPAGALMAMEQPCHLLSLMGQWQFQAAAPLRTSLASKLNLAAKRPTSLPEAQMTPRGSVFDLTRSGMWGYRAGAAWRRIPKFVQFSMALIPMLFTAGIYGWPSRPAAERAGAEVQAFAKNRAGVEFSEEFRAGLDQWRARSNVKPAWSFDAAGFVHPSQIALYKPTLGLTDYQLEFLAEIDQRAFGFVFRAADLNDYYAVKFVVAEPGPLPRMQIVRYAVIHGREGPRTIRTLPLTVRNDTWYQVRLNVKGSDFTLITQGKIADYWSDARLKNGGVGFFCGLGEHARLRSVKVSHQYDALGRFFAYLNP